MLPGLFDFGISRVGRQLTAQRKSFSEGALFDKQPLFN